MTPNISTIKLMNGWIEVDGEENGGSKKNWEEIKKNSQNEISLKLKPGPGFKTDHLYRIYLVMFKLL